jgi:hypothetical protein
MLAGLKELGLRYLPAGRRGPRFFLIARRA